MTDNSLLPRGSTGVNVPISSDGSHLEDARLLDRAGYDTLWIAGGQLDTLDRVDELIDATPTARIATGIVALGVFDDATVATAYRARRPRFVLGLGGPQQARPLAALGRHLDALDTAGVGAPERLLAALGPKKLRIAADRAAGAITLLTTPEATASARRTLGAGPILAVHQVAVLDDDARRARGAVSEMLGFLSRVDGYRASFARMGFSARDVDEQRDAFVDAVTVWGDAAAIAARVTAHRRAGADHVALSFVSSGNGVSVADAATASATSLGLSAA